MVLRRFLLRRHTRRFSGWRLLAGNKSPRSEQNLREGGENRDKISGEGRCGFAVLNGDHPSSSGVRFCRAGGRCFVSRRSGGRILCFWNAGPSNRILAARCSAASCWLVKAGCGISAFRGHPCGQRFRYGIPPATGQAGASARAGSSRCRCRRPTACANRRSGVGIGRNSLRWRIRLEWALIRFGRSQCHRTPRTTR